AGHPAWRDVARRRDRARRDARARAPDRPPLPDGARDQPGRRGAGRGLAGRARRRCRDGRRPGRARLRARQLLAAEGAGALRRSLSRAPRPALVVAFVCAVAVAAGASARAEGGRYAVLVGDNEGDHGETILRYAEADARRVAAVLRAVGGFLPEDVML